MVQKHISFPWLQHTHSGLLTGQSKPTQRPNKFWITGLTIVWACYFHSHHAFIPHSLPDQETQNKVMNRNFPVLEYLETVSLKYLMRPNEPLRARDTYTASTTDVSPLVWQPCLSSCCFLWKEYWTCTGCQLSRSLQAAAQSNRLTLYHKKWNCWKTAANVLLYSVELYNPLLLFLFPLTNTVKRNSNTGTKPRLSFLAYLPQNMHNNLKSFSPRSLSS